MNDVKLCRLKNLLTVQEVAGVLKLSEMTVNRLINEGSLCTVNYDDRRYIHQSDLLIYLDEHLTINLPIFEEDFQEDDDKSGCQA